MPLERQYPVLLDDQERCDSLADSYGYQDEYDEDGSYYDEDDYSEPDDCDCIHCSPGLYDEEGNLF